MVDETIAGRAWAASARATLSCPASARALSSTSATYCCPAGRARRASSLSRGRCHQSQRKSSAAPAQACGLFSICVSSCGSWAVRGAVRRPNPTPRADGSAACRRRGAAATGSGVVRERADGSAACRRPAASGWLRAAGHGHEADAEKRDRVREG